MRHVPGICVASPTQGTKGCCDARLTIDLPGIVRNHLRLTGNMDAGLK